MKTEENCKQYIKSDGLNFCMSSVCPKKDCIYALVNKLHQTIDRLEQENKQLKKDAKKTSDGLLKIQYKLANNCDKYRSAVEEIKKYVTKWQGLCFDEQTADELMKICEVLK